MSNELPIYTPAHKGLRFRLYTLAITAGKLDYTNQTALEAFYQELATTQALIRFHDQWEEEGIHPLLADKVPGGAERLEEEHRALEHMLDNLVASVNGIRTTAADFEKRPALGLECYLALNRFIEFLVGHLNDEEEQIQPTLWRLCTNEELIAAVRHMPSSMTPEFAMANFQVGLPALNVDELTMILTQMKATVPPLAFESVMHRAARVVDPEEWDAVKVRMEGSQG